MAVGDIMLARTVGERIRAEGPQVVFAGVQEIFAQADLLVGNLECAITDRGQPQPKAFTFAAPLESAEALGLAGFDLLALGNNHALDYGQEGIAQTIELLTRQGIATVGFGPLGKAAGPVILEKNGLRIAFLSYVDVLPENPRFDTRTWIATADLPGIAWAEEEQIRRDVSAARAQADLVLVFMHFGIEGRERPIANQRQVAVAALEAGATAVLGSHPHLLQRLEVYQGGLIAYSLGNFVFDGYYGWENRSAILRLILTSQGLEAYDWFPIFIVNGLPQPAPDHLVEEIYRMLTR